MALTIAIMGSGGLGGFFGALLATAGEDVAFLARGAHLAAIRRNGLRVESARGDMHIHPATATDDPASVGPVDCVLFTVKLWDTETAAAACRPSLGADTAVLTLQNGIDSMARLAAVLGEEHVLGGVTYVPSVIAEPGVIRHTGSAANLIFGEPGGGRSARAGRLLAVFRRAGVEAEISADIRRTIWEKFVFLAASSGVTSFTGLSYGPMRADPEARGNVSPGHGRGCRGRRRGRNSHRRRFYRRPHGVSRSGAARYDVVHGPGSIAGQPARTRLVCGNRGCASARRMASKHRLTPRSITP